MIYSVYLITNILNNIQYVGITKRTIDQRWNDHKSCAKAFARGRLKHGCTRLYNAINTHGADNFKLEKIAEAPSRIEANRLEQEYIAKFNTLSPNGYNLTTGGDSFDHCEETKKRISENTSASITQNIDKYRYHEDILKGLPKRFIYKKPPKEGIALWKHPLCDFKLFSIKTYNTWDAIREAALKFLKELEEKNEQYIPTSGSKKKHAKV